MDDIHENVLYLLRDRSPESYDKASEGEDDKLEEEEHPSDIQESEEEDFSDDETNFVDNINDEVLKSSSAKRDREKYIILGRGGKNTPKFKWSLNAPRTCGKRSETIPQTVGAAQNIKEPIEAWQLLLPDSILNVIAENTNIQITETKKRYQENHRRNYMYNTSLVEVKAFIGLMYFIGTKRQNHTNIADIWNPKIGDNLCQISMGKSRFEFLLANIRFDDKASRAKRIKQHGLAPIKQVWDAFLANCQEYYKPSANCTIDVQLLAFRRRSIAKVYISKKPAKSGIKIVSCNDAQTSYMINAEPYVGRGPGSYDNSARHYITTLTKTIHNTNRNITCNNCFTQVPLVQEMKKKYGLTMVGALKKNEPEIPASFTRSRGTCPGFTKYAYADGMTLLSYCLKRNKVLVLISSLHSKGQKLKDALKPEIMNFYNNTKSGTDIFDQLCNDYTTARITNRWPLRLFYGILDQAGINSNILYNFAPKAEKLHRLNYLRTLAISLITPILHERLTIPTLQHYKKLRIREFLNISEDDEELVIKFEDGKRRFCSLCDSNNKRRTIWCCSICKCAACDEHRQHVCPKCK